MASSGDPVILEAIDKLTAPSQRSTIIFLHGLGDDGNGTGYGLAQQFQIFNKLPRTRWVLPTASVDKEVGERCWYKPHPLPSPQHHEDVDAAVVDEAEDEEGILRAVAFIDDLVAGEVDKGVDPAKIAVGGFSQGCATSTIWGLKGKWRDRVAGVFGLGGYFPKIKAILPDAVAEGDEGGKKPAPQWFFGHGMGDMAVSVNLFAEGQKRMQQYVERESVEGHVYQDLTHDVGGGEIRDLWLWLKKVLQEESGD